MSVQTIRGPQNLDFTTLIGNTTTRPIEWEDASNNLFLAANSNFLDFFGFGGTSGMYQEDFAGTQVAIWGRLNVPGLGVINGHAIRPSATDFGCILGLLDNALEDVIRFDTWSGLLLVATMLLIPQQENSSL